jgi:hypothetical protein
MVNDPVVAFGIDAEVVVFGVNLFGLSQWPDLDLKNEDLF